MAESITTFKAFGVEFEVVAVGSVNRTADAYGTGDSPTLWETDEITECWIRPNKHPTCWSLAAFEELPEDVQNELIGGLVAAAKGE